MAPCVWWTPRRSARPRWCERAMPMGWKQRQWPFHTKAVGYGKTTGRRSGDLYEGAPKKGGVRLGILCFFCFECFWIYRSGFVKWKYGWFCMNAHYNRHVWWLQIELQRHEGLLNFEDVRDVSFSPKTKSTFQLSMRVVKTLSIIEKIITHEMGIPGLLCATLRKLWI